MRRRWADTATQMQLAEMSARGLSAGQIARKVGATKDQVASAMSRYGLFSSSRPERRLVTLAKPSRGLDVSPHCHC
jgi:hypothetical protein